MTRSHWNSLMYNLYHFRKFYIHSACQREVYEAVLHSILQVGYGLDVRSAGLSFAEWKHAPSDDVFMRNAGISITLDK